MAFNFGAPAPVDVGAILASFEATRKRGREEEIYARKQAEETAARQHLGAALQGDPNALQALFTASPERGMAVAKYLDAKAAGDLNRKLIEARIARLSAPPGARGARAAVAGVPLPPEEEPPPVAMPGMPSGAGPVAPGGVAGGIPGGPLPSRAPAPVGPPGMSGGGTPAMAPYEMRDPNAAPAPPVEALPPSGPALGRPSPQQLAEAIEARRMAMAPGGGIPRETSPVVPVQATGGPPQRGAPPLDYQSAAAAGYRPAMDGRGRPVVGPGGSVAMYPPGAKGPRDIVFVPMKGPKAAGVPEEGGGTAGPAGKSVEAWALNVLLNGDPASPEYRAAYGKIAAGKVGPDGAIVQPDMRHFRPPVTPGAAPTETPPQGAGQPGPGRTWSPERGEWVQSQGGPAPSAPIGTPVVTEPAGPRATANDRAKLRAMQVGASSLVKSLEDFAEAFEKADPNERMQTVAGMPTRLNTLWGLAAVLAKGDELMQLGVIAGPDLQIIRRTLADPSTLAGATADPKRVRQQVKAVTDLVKFRIAEHERLMQGGPAVAPSPAAPAATPAPDLRRKYNLE